MVARRNLDSEIKAALKEIIIESGNDPAGAEILEGTMSDRFV
jgi:ABC-type phosphate/phosphonate transport system substrate-binding protein